jgi:hypothetical protein
MTRRGIPARRRTDPLASFLVYLEEVEHAVLERESLRITALLRKRTATHLPREVREELLALSRAPRQSLRAPVRFLQFQHRMTQLAIAGEPLPTAQTELGLDPPRPTGIVRLRMDERRPAASEQTGGDTRSDDDAS